MERYINTKDGRRLMDAAELADFEARIVVETPEEIFDKKVIAFSDKTKEHLDSLAQSWGYDNIISLCTYEGNSSPKYSAEGAAGKTWRSEVWEYFEIEMEKIRLGTRPEPESAEAFILELPAIIRP